MLRLSEAWRMYWSFLRMWQQLHFLPTSQWNPRGQYCCKLSTGKVYHRSDTKWRWWLQLWWTWAQFNWGDDIPWESMAGKFMWLGSTKSWYVTCIVATHLMCRKQVLIILSVTTWTNKHFYLNMFGHNYMHLILLLHWWQNTVQLYRKLLFIPGILPVVHPSYRWWCPSVWSGKSGWHLRQQNSGPWLQFLQHSL